MKKTKNNMNEHAHMTGKAKRPLQEARFTNKGRAEEHHYLSYATPTKEQLAKVAELVRDSYERLARWPAGLDSVTELKSPNK